MTNKVKMNKKDILHLVIAIISTIAYGGCAFWAHSYVSSIVSIVLFSSIPVLLTLFLLGIFLKKDGLYKIALTIAYIGAIVLVCVCLVLQSGILDEFLTASDGKELGEKLQSRFGNYVYLAVIVVEFLQVVDGRVAVRQFASLLVEHLRVRQSILDALKQ